MNNKSDFLDMGEKLAELHNIYLDNQKGRIKKEIMLIDRMMDNIVELRKYMATILEPGREQILSDSAIKSLAEIRANYLYNDLNKLGSKIETMPLKVIVKCLKANGE